MVLKRMWGFVCQPANQKIIFDKEEIVMRKEFTHSHKSDFFPNHSVEKFGMVSALRTFRGQSLMNGSEKIGVLQRTLFFILCSLFFCVANAQSQSMPQRVDEASQPASSTAVEGYPQYGLQDILVCTGDSITRGYGLAFPSSEGYVSRLSVLTGINTVNTGVDGVLSGYGAQMIDYYLDQYKPQTLTIYYGNNDACNISTADVIFNLRHMVDHCLAYGTRPILATLGPQFYDAASRNPCILDINEGIRLLAAEKKITVADIGSVLWGQQDYFIDWIHPNSAGHAIIADTFFRAINSCYGISPLSESFQGSGGTGSVSVTTCSTCLACSWTAKSNAEWITVTGSGSGVGSGTVSYQVALNNTGSERTGTLTIARNTFTVIQKKVPALNFLILLLDE